MKHIILLKFTILLYSGLAFASPPSAQSFLANSLPQGKSEFSEAFKHTEGRMPQGSSGITLSRNHYIWSGVVGTVVPFGVGQAIQGRWKRSGWKITVLDTLAIASKVAESTSKNPKNKKTLNATFLLLFGISRLWNFIDIWFLLPPDIKIVSQRFRVFPYFYATKRDRHTMGVQVNYLF